MSKIRHGRLRFPYWKEEVGIEELNEERKYLIVKKVHCKGIESFSPQLVFEALLSLS